MWLNSISLENFKSHENNDFQCGKITVLIGHNNSGKSSVLQAMIMLAQSAESSNGMSFMPRNDVMDLGEYRDIVRLNNEETPIAIGMAASQSIDLGGEYNGTISPERAEFYFRVTTGKNNKLEIDLFVESRHTKISYNWKPTGISATLTRPFENESFELTQTSMNGFVPGLQLKTGPENIRFTFNKQFGDSDFLRKMLQQFYYVPFQRVIGKYAVEITQKQKIENIVTSDPEKTSSALLSTLAKDPILRQKVSNLYASMYGETLTSHNVDPDIRDRAKSNVERISLLFSNGQFASSIANEGTGINQLVLLFTILAGSPKNSVICIEEPEIHLHPAKQSQLAKTILKISKDENKQIILTTHSEYVLYQLLAAVSSGELNPEDLSIYYFQHDVKTNSTTRERLAVNNKGQIKGGLKGFWEATVSAMAEFIDEEK